MTGVSAAYHLAQAVASDAAGASMSAVVLEARDFCSGATGRNGGHFTPHAYGEFRSQEQTYGTDEALRHIAIEQYTVSEVFKILKEAGKVEHVDFVPGGRVILFFTAQEYDEARKDYEAAAQAGIVMNGVEWLSKAQVEERYGTSHPAVLIPGNNLWPLKLASVLYNLAEGASDRFSLELHTRTPVTRVAPSPVGSARRWELTTPRGAVACSYVLHATNAYAGHLLPWLHGPDGIVPTRGQVITTRAAAPFALGRAGFVSDTGYWFPRPNKTATERQLVLLGGGRKAGPGKEFESNVVDDSVLNPEVGKVLREFLPAVYPGKFEEGTEPEMEWTGIMGFTKNKDPFVGPVVDPNDPDSLVKYKGQYIAAGYSGHGMPRTFACAEAVAKMIYADMTGGKWAAPEWMPLHYLTTTKV
ncbi:hypothetical protein PHLGIDRAFT_20543 [Phlebiopsis gigantea 11061_1 CR5-6]|uniref:FAD dependent oxidoreductase domain-containing protein n=1 Tax=Phlebiopsis gigantea (strain 11061_1 CR5-6) TaxID=745531 RepID=A0A0C3RQE8_PHLG1|nr:hypothetical protein PHLGIDRAFT_20543 [Phlebiopsis gigantea 11061_1 CR5-6]